MSEQKYNFIEKEKYWQDFWKTNKVYDFNFTETKENNFVIDTPPPTISGNLHIGHVFSFCQADFIGRFQRMQGKNVFYPIGFDDNGLATERLVEKVKNIKASTMQREEFIKICSSTVEEYEEDFRDLFKSLALSVDWNLEYQTISSFSRKVSQMSFLDLYKKNAIYRNNQPMFWDIIDQTVLAQAEIVEATKDSAMNYIKFYLDGEEAVIATTRPELLPACVAVFYNPEDKRYNHLESKFITTPLFDLKVPLLADPLVDIEKGTGLVMCCTFGDVTDILWWKKHKLDLRIIISKIGKLQDLDFTNISSNPQKASNSYDNIKGLNIKEARIKIIELLENDDLVIKKDPITHNVKSAERSGGVLEILVTPQWFIKVMEHKEELKERSNQINWHPLSMKIKLDQWIDNLSWDWCISRQRYFGVPIPVWYSKRKGEEGKILLPGIDQLPIDPIKDLPKGYSREEVQAEIDVMDTWATSSVTPQLNSQGISKDFMIDEVRHNSLFPADLRTQAHEIIRSWAFYTIVKSHLHQDTIPWKNIMISGWCLASDKTKMSKSKGNIVEPRSLITQYGTDVLRYWASVSRLGADTAYSEDVMKIGKKLVNKLLNATKFVSLHFNNLDLKELNKIAPETLVCELVSSKKIFYNMDLWILNQLNEVIKKSTNAFTNYEYSEARSYIEEFFWKDFCDNYLEIIKVRVYGETEEDIKGKYSAIYSLYICILNILKLFAPFIPHVTEELYQLINEGKSIHSKGSWSKVFDINTSSREAEVLLFTLEQVRKVKSEKQISLKTAIPLIEINSLLSSDILIDLKNVTNCESVNYVSDINDKLIKFENENFKMGILINL